MLRAERAKRRSGRLGGGKSGAGGEKFFGGATRCATTPSGGKTCFTAYFREKFMPKNLRGKKKRPTFALAFGEQRFPRRLRPGEESENLLKVPEKFGNPENPV